MAVAADCCGSAYYDEDFLQTPLKVEDGFAYPPEGPGLGVEIDEEGLRHHTHHGPWRQRIMRRHPEDGTFSDF